MTYKEDVADYNAAAEDFREAIKAEDLDKAQKDFDKMLAWKNHWNKKGGYLNRAVVRSLEALKRKKHG